MKTLIFFILVCAALSLACGGNQNRNTNSNGASNISLVQNANVKNANLSILNNSNNLPVNNSVSNVNPISETPSQMNPETLKQIEDQQKETNDIRKVANDLRDPNEKKPAKPTKRPPDF
jgi:hypothetical protein